jgi:hypothetical protein
MLDCECSISNSKHFYHFFWGGGGTHKHIYYHKVSELRSSVSNPTFCQRSNNFHSVVYWELVLAYYQVFNIYII